MKLYMFRTVPLSIIRSLFTAHSAMVYVWHIPLLSVQWINSWWWTVEMSKTCRVSCQNKFVKLVHLVGFIIKKYISTVCTPVDRQPRPRASISCLSTLTGLARTPSRAPAIQRYIYRTARHESSVAPWRWGRSQSLKHGRTLTPWPACLHEEINIA